jgi:hypothetical protein
VTLKAIKGINFIRIGWPRSDICSKILNDNIFFIWFEILLISRLVFHRGSSVSTMMESRMRDVAMICKSTV